MLMIIVMEVNRNGNYYDNDGVSNDMEDNYNRVSGIDSEVSIE